MASRKKSDHTFAVKLDGITLPDDASDRITKVIQRAVLSEIAALDVGPDYSVSLLDGTDSGKRSRALATSDFPGTTQGIIVRFDPTA